MNVNLTNLISRKIAESFWGGPDSGLQGWDLLTPNRASSNIGEFAILLPGEEQIVVTKEVFVIRLVGGTEEGWDPFYLFWGLCWKAVRRQRQRITLMQTNREDCGDILLVVFERSVDDLHVAGREMLAAKDVHGPKGGLEERQVPEGNVAAVIDDIASNPISSSITVP